MLKGQTPPRKLDILRGNKPSGKPPKQTAHSSAWMMGYARRRETYNRVWAKVHLRIPFLNPWERVPCTGEPLRPRVPKYQDAMSKGVTRMSGEPVNSCWLSPLQDLVLLGVSQSSLWQAIRRRTTPHASASLKSCSMRYSSTDKMVLKEQSCTAIRRDLKQ
jgi:hypothetical protein